MAVRDVKDASQAKAASRVYVLPYDLLGNSRNSNLGSLGAIESNLSLIKKRLQKKAKRSYEDLSSIKE